MVLSLTNLSAMKIPVNTRLNSTARVATENIAMDCYAKLKHLAIERDDLNDEYLEIKREYYNTLTTDTMDAEVYQCAHEMSMKYNNIIEFRNEMALMRLWSRNYVLLDISILKYISWPSASAERQELLTLFYGVFSHHKEVVMVEPTATEQVLVDMVNEYVQRCKYWYGFLNVDINAESVVKLSNTMNQINAKITYIEKEIEYRTTVLTRLTHVIEYTDISNMWSDLGDLSSAGDLGDLSSAGDLGNIGDLDDLSDLIASLTDD